MMIITFAETAMLPVPHVVVDQKATNATAVTRQDQHHSIIPPIALALPHVPRGLSFRIRQIKFVQNATASA